MLRSQVARRVWVGALLTGLLAWVPACGGKDEATNPPTASGGGASGGAPTRELASVDPADVAGYDAWLKANDLEAPEVSLSTHRGGGSETTAWPLLPRGEVRLDGLTVWRLEADLESFDPEAGGVLEFRKGKNVLWRDTVPFDPKEMRIIEGGLPKNVLDAVKVGDTITWGIAYEKQPKRSMLGEFKVVSKPSAAKQIDRIENDRLNARQPAKVKALGRAQALLNNSLYAEALLVYMGLAVGTGEDPTVQEAGYRIVECMRRLGLDEAPLYSDAMALAGARKGKRNPGATPGIAGSGPTQGLPAVAPYVAPGATPTADPTPPPGEAPTPAPNPSRREPTSEQGRRAVAAIDQQAQKAADSARMAEERLKQMVRDGLPTEAQIPALQAAAEAAKGTPREPEARAAVDAALAKLALAAQAREQAEDAQNDPRLIERLRELAAAGEPVPPQAPGTGPLGLLAKEADAAMKKASALGAEAARLRRDAEEIAGREGAEALLRTAEEAESKAQAATEAALALQKRAEKQLLDASGAAKKPAEPPASPAERLAVLAQWAHRLDQEAKDLQAEADELRTRSHAAQEAGDPELAKSLEDQSRQTREAAKVAEQRAQAAQEALRALTQAGG